MGQGSLFYELPIFQLGETGFPSEFSVFLFGQSAYESTNIGGPLGPRAMHSFAPSAVYKAGSPAKLRVWTESGAIIPFQQNGGGSWSSEEGHVATLAINPVGGCTGTTVLTLGNGTKYTFGEVGPSPCVGAVAEGRIQRIDRPNGDYLTFAANVKGYIATVTNRRGAFVTLTHTDDGLLQKVFSPTNQEFVFAYDATNYGFLKKVTRTGDTMPLWNLSWGSNGGTYMALTQVLDARGMLEHAWTYSGSTMTRVSRECGPGGPADCSTSPSRIELAYPTNGQTTVTFTGADGASATNTANYATQSGQRPRVTQRTLQGACPGCGDSSDAVEFWAGKTWAKWIEDANGFVTVQQDLSLAEPSCTDPTTAFDSLGNSTVRYEGCTGPISGWVGLSCADILTQKCSSATRRVFSYLTGTRTVSGAQRPSAGGGTVADSRTFVGSLNLPVLDRVQGKTVDALDGTLDVTKLRTTARTYGGADGVDVIQIDGPFDDPGSGIPPSDSGKTVLAYFAISEADGCTGATSALNTKRLKSATRWVDASRTLVTYFCDYDAAGRARKVKAPDGTLTRRTFDWRGRTTQVVEDDGGLGLTSDFVYDASGNLLEMKGPRTTANGRGGWQNVYDDADRLTETRQGYFSGTSFTALQRMRYSYDAWGNRLKQEWVNAAGSVVEQSEGTAYDAYNRLACLARPDPGSGSGACAAAQQKTQFFYDAEGHLTRVSDAEGDEVRYGSLADLQEYDRFGRVERVQQEICSTPGCGSPVLANVDYTYDPASQLATVAVNDAVRGGTITTSYVTDDFGAIVKVVSPDAGTAFFRYDGAGRLFESQDARGKKFRYLYDRLGRITDKINVTGTPVTEAKYCYDGQDSACGYTNVTRSAGRLTAVDDKAGKIQFFYDGVGRETQEVRTLNSSAVFTTTWVLDADGNATSTTYPSGLVFTKTFDEASRETSAAFSGAGSSGSMFTDGQWYAFGGLKSWKPAFASFQMTIDMDTAGRITQTRLADGATTKESVTYTYASDGNVTSDSSAHDSLSRLTSNQGFSYTYDHAGNRTSTTAPGGNYVYASPSNDRLASTATLTFGYDAAGNVTSRTGVSAIGVADDGSVTSVTTSYGTTTYVRDYRNLRVEKAGAGGSGTFFHSPSGDLIQWIGPTYSGSGTAVPGCAGSNTLKTPYEHYLYLGGRRVAMLKTIFCHSGSGSFVNPTKHWYFADKMDMPRAMYTNQQTPVWHAGSAGAFGVLPGELTDPDGDGKQVRVPFRLPGQFAMTVQEGGPAAVGPTSDRMGLHENWWRIYDSAVGRYLEVDPLQVDATVERNRPTNGPYVYAEVSPLRFHDRDGRRPTARLCCRPVNISALRALGAKHCFLEGDNGDVWSLFPDGDPDDDGVEMGYPSGNTLPSGAPSPDRGLSSSEKKCRKCRPKPGCEDPRDCFDRASEDYGPTAYNAMGANSNRFAGTIYRECCDDAEWYSPAGAWGWPEQESHDP